MTDATHPLERAFLIWGALLLLSTASGHLYSPDDEIQYRTARSLATGNGFAIPPYPAAFGTRAGLDGKEYPQYGPLQPILAVPLYWTGRALAAMIPAAWLEAQAERLYRTVGFYRPLTSTEGSFEGLYPSGHPERVCRGSVSLFNPLMTWLTVLLLCIWSRRLFGSGLAALSLPFVYLVGTYAWPHSRTFFSEPLAALLLLVAVWLADGIGRQGAWLMGRCAGVGVAAGMALLARADSVVAVPGIAFLALYRLWDLRHENLVKKKVVAVGAGLASLVATGSLQLLLNQLHFGSPFSSGYSDQPEGIHFDIPLLTALWIYLISPGKGIFGYSPPLLAGLVAWPAFFRKDRGLAWGTAGIILGYLLVVGRWQNLGGWCWGPRHLFQVTPFLLLPLPLIWRPNGPSGIRQSALWLFGVMFAAGIAVQIPGILIDFMWPLDQTLRGLAPGEDTARVLSVSFYGPMLHLWSWRLDPEPDWWLMDLWRSGETGARLLAGTVWTGLVVASVQLAWTFRKAAGRSSQNGCEVRP